MPTQSILKQILVGAFLGVLVGMVNILNQPDRVPPLSPYGIGLLAGSAIVGVFFYLLLYQFLSKKK